MPNPSKPEVTSGTAKLAAGKTIYVSNPKDKRLLAYNDSLRTFRLWKPLKAEMRKKLNTAKTLKEWADIKEKVGKKYDNAGFNPNLIINTDDVAFTKQLGNVEKIVQEAYVKKPTTRVILQKKEKPAPVKKLTKVDSVPVKKVTEVKPLPIKKVSKVNVAAKELNMPAASIKVQRTVKMPSGIRDIKYDTQKGTVLVNLDGAQKSMPRKEFDIWVNKPDNRKMFDDYRKSKAKK
jgi:hypothetical protein